MEKGGQCGLGNLQKRGGKKPVSGGKKISAAVNTG
jgi:hypothetical protein